MNGHGPIPLQGLLGVHRRGKLGGSFSGTLEGFMLAFTLPLANVIYVCYRVMCPSLCERMPFCSSIAVCRIDGLPAYLFLPLLFVHSSGQRVPCPRSLRASVSLSATPSVPAPCRPVRSSVIVTILIG